MGRHAYEILADAVLAAHLLWIVWVVFGGLLTRGRPRLAIFHVLSLVWGVAVDAGPWTCPLTVLEQFLESRAWLTPYTQGFLQHYLEAVVYPDISPLLLTACAAGVCLFNLGLYGLRLYRGAYRRAAGA